MNVQAEAFWVDDHLDDIGQRQAENRRERDRLNREDDQLWRLRQRQWQHDRYMALARASYQAHPRKFASRRDKHRWYYVAYGGPAPRAEWPDNRPAQFRWRARDMAKRADQQPRGFDDVHREWLCCGKHESVEVRFGKDGKFHPEEVAKLAGLTYYHECSAAE